MAPEGWAWTSGSRRQIGPLLGPLRQASIKTLIVAPQATGSPKREKGKGGWQVTDLDLLLAHLLETLPVDPDRVYLTGNSMGGYGTFMWAGYRPGHFAAIAPMVGGIGQLGPKDVTKDLDLWGRNLARLPMRAYYGGKDRVVPADRGDMIMKAIGKAGGKQAELIVFEDKGHDAGRVPIPSPSSSVALQSQEKEVTTLGFRVARFGIRAMVVVCLVATGWSENGRPRPCPSPAKWTSPG